MHALHTYFVILQFDWSLHVKLPTKTVRNFVYKCLILIKLYGVRQSIFSLHCIYMGMNVKPKSPESETHTQRERERDTHLCFVQTEFDQHNQYKATTSKMCIIAQKCSNKTSPHIYSHCLLSVIAVVAAASASTAVFVVAVVVVVYRTSSGNSNRST